MDADSNCVTATGFSQLLNEARLALADALG